MRIFTPSWSAGNRQSHVVTLDGGDLDGGPWYAPRLAFFSHAVEAQGQRVDFDNIDPGRSGGRNLIENGDFGRSTARWFPVSEKIHLPWHIKSLALNVLFDQGRSGSLFVLLVGARSSLDSGSRTPPSAGAVHAAGQVCRRRRVRRPVDVPGSRWRSTSFC
jgi:hypothetical protein